MDPPSAHQPQTFFCQFDCLKKKITGKIKNLEPHKVLSLGVCSVGGKARQ